MDPAEIGAFFQTAPVKILDNAALREPQVEGYRAVLSHFQSLADHAILQIPVGCGKTGLMNILPFGLANGRVLIIAPNLEIRKGVADALDVSDPGCFLRKTSVLDDVSAGPFRAVLDTDANIHDCNNAHFVVTNIHQLANSADRWLPQFGEDFFDLILVDEAHHNAAASWQRVFGRFPRARVVSLTATPFRSDNREVEGETIYRYSFSHAMENGYIKKLRAADAQPSEIYFEFQGDEHHHTLEEVLQMRDEAWFRQGVALSRPTNESIVNTSLEVVERLRATGTKHQIVAAAMSMNHARAVASLYRERGYEADVVTSDMLRDDRVAVLRRLRSGELDCIVQVNILGEGFDWPQLSVAAIFRPYRSLSPYIQFVGRVMRVIVQNNPFHADNEGWVVSHIGLQQDERWNEFGRFDDDDQELFHQLAQGVDPGPQREGEPVERRRLRPNMRVIQETLEGVVTRQFLDDTGEAAVDHVMAEMQKAFGGIPPEDLGLTREEIAGRLVRAQQRQRIQPRERVPQPQEHRKELRRRLDESIHTAASHILAAIKLAPTSAEVPRRMQEAAGAGNNLGATIRLFNMEVKAALRTEGVAARADMSIEQLESAIERVDEFADAVETKIRNRMQADD